MVYFVCSDRNRISPLTLTLASCPENNPLIEGIGSGLTAKVFFDVCFRTAYLNNWYLAGSWIDGEILTMSLSSKKNPINKKRTFLPGSDCAPYLETHRISTKESFNMRTHSAWIYFNLCELQGSMYSHLPWLYFCKLIKWNFM